MSAPQSLDPSLLAHAAPGQRQHIEAVIEHGGVEPAARATGVNGRTIRRAVAAVRRKASAAGVVRAVPPHVRRWLLTTAQDDTPVHPEFWRNWLAYAAQVGAEIMVAGNTYQKGLFEDHASRSAVFAEAVREFMVHDNVSCGPLLFAAKMNILPTAVRPLSGLETYSRGAWAVFPHQKVQMLSVPALPGQRPAQVVTTGTCTIPNYVEKKAGLKAEFHHTIGGVIVEVDAEDRVFYRHIMAAGDGSFQDLDAVTRDGRVSYGHRIEAMGAGDLHIEKADPEVYLASFGYCVDQQRVINESSLIHTLRPRHIAWHDILDMMARNHHRRGDHHFAFRMLCNGSDRVEDGVVASARFLRAMAFDWTTNALIRSNHDEALVRWLREADPRADPPNARYWCELNAELYRQIESGDFGFDIIRWALSRHDPAGRQLDDIVFVPRNGSYLVCQAQGGIEMGMHGDEGPNGARGSALALTRVATRMIIGHGHSPCWVDGVMMLGLSGMLDQHYNSGPSGWNHTHGLVYPNSKRTLITLIDGKWRA